MQKRNSDYLAAALFVIGLIVVYLFPNISPWLSNLGKIAILLGMVIFLVRVHRTVRAFLDQPQTDEIKQGEIEMRLLIQVMGIIARADGKIEAIEIDTICEIHARMFGINMSKEEVEKILSELNSPIEILGSLGQNKSKISPLMKQKIIQACHLVVISDLDIDDKESAQIGAIGLALGFSETEIKEMVALAEI
ncbi:MAG: hypothetical protein QM488_08810 [Rhizobiaceae bacterium]